MSTDVDEFLAHYGVKGMKWGVIRKDPSGGESKAPSRREVRTTAAYLRKGFDAETAARKAQGRIAVENALLIAGGTAVASAAVYAGVRAGQRYFGAVNIPMGTPVHHVNVHGPDLNVQAKPMFVSFKKSDQKFYDSVFANFAKDRARAENIYKSTLEATTDIRAPSNFEARRLYREFQKSHPDLKSSYADFNYSFNGEGNGSARMKRAFADFMQGKGYNAMIDNFDSVKSTRVRTMKPTILFDPTKSIKKVDDILLNSGKVQTSALKYELLSTVSKGVTSPKALIFSVLFGLGAFSNHRGNERPRELRVDEYKKMYPGTELSDAEIYNLVGANA